MVHAAMSRLGEGLYIRSHLLLMAFDIVCRMFLINYGVSSSVYLMVVNAIMGTPHAICTYRLLTHKDRDPQSVSLAVAYGIVAFMAICVTPIAVSLGEGVSGDNYFSSFYWVMLSILLVVGILIMALSFGFTVATDLLREAKEAPNEVLVRRNMSLTQRLNELEMKYSAIMNIAEMKDQHISNTIHDLRQPLHALRLKMHHMMQGNSGDNQSFDEVKQTFRYLEDLVSDHLSNTGDAMVVDLENDSNRDTRSVEENADNKLTSGAILTSVYEMFLPDAEEKGLTLHYNRTDHEVNVDGLDLMRIASNLVSNAIKYTQSGTVSFGLSEVNGKIRLEVRDTGVGMASEEFEAALAHNVRLKNGASQEVGNGFGLSIVKELVDKHHLTLSLHPNVKRGTGVVIDFPAAA